jgi:nicotinamide-nucleotide amidase
MVADGVMRTFVTILDDYIYALEDISLAQRLYELLKLRRMKISVAESFTGGGICKKLVEVSGVSQVFFEGLNTYSNEAKMGRLGVNEITLKQFGAVSDETAYQMAEGLIKSGNCDISIATTGIAGPKSDNTNKPVGLAYIAIGLKERIAVYKFNFSGDRTNITNTAINQALFLAYKNLK